MIKTLSLSLPLVKAVTRFTPHFRQNSESGINLRSQGKLLVEQLARHSQVSKTGNLSVGMLDEHLFLTQFYHPHFSSH